MEVCGGGGRGMKVGMWRNVANGRGLKVGG